MSARPTLRRATRAVLAVAALAVTSTGLAGCMNADATALHQEVNAQRTANGVAALPEHAGLTDRAQAWAQQIGGERALRHTDPSWYRDTGCTYIGENIAYSWDRARIVPMWMGSTGHRANIVHPYYTATGVGSFRDAGGTYWAVQVFARCPTPAP